MNKLAEKIITLGKKIGFDLVGLIDAGKIEGWEEIMLKFRGKGYLSPILDNYSLDRANPGLILPGAQSVIMVGLAYRVSKVKPKKLAGVIAAGVRGEDYHHKIYRMLARFSIELKQLVTGDFRQVHFVDNKPVPEKAMAIKAGFGFFGKNSLLVNPEFGSCLFLGGLITDLELGTRQADQGKPTTAASKSGCGDCARCISACPTQAIIKPGVIDTRRCLAQLTQNKGIVPATYREKFQFSLYGCDICQQVCPFNLSRLQEETGLNEMEGQQASFDLVSVIGMGKKEFDNSIGKTAAGWRGKTVMQRNAVIGLGNWQDEAAIPVLAQAAADQRPVIRAHAVWALGKIGGCRAREILGKVAIKEKNPLVLEEFSLVMK